MTRLYSDINGGINAFNVLVHEAKIAETKARALKHKRRFDEAATQFAAAESTYSDLRRYCLTQEIMDIIIDREGRCNKMWYKCLEKALQN